MYKNYLKTALRNLRNKLAFTLINISGLSIALAASFIIILFVVNELSYNNCHKNKDDIYRVNGYYEGFKIHTASSPFGMASTLKEEIPQVDKVTNTRRFRSFTIKLKDEFINVRNSIGTQSEIFDIFTIPIIQGSNTGKLLDDKHSICLSESLAKKLFGQQNALGQEIITKINKKEHNFTVAAVYKDLPKNSTFSADCFVHVSHTFPFINTIFRSNDAETDWQKDFWTTWVKFIPGTTAEQIEPQLISLGEKYLPKTAERHYTLQNLSDIYLSSFKIQSSGPKGSWKTIKIFLAIAILIILVAIINYVILSTAVSSGRTKEIGIRKTFGAGNKQVKYQFLMESVILSFMVLPIAVLLMLLAIPQAEALFDTKLPIIGSNIIYYLLVYIALTIVIGLISGLYTSVGLSRLNVIKILKMENLQGKKKNYIRSSLIVFQLIIFCFFVASAFVIQSQYQFALKTNPGFNNKNILLVNFDDKQIYEPFLNEVKNNSNVINAGGTMSGLPMLNSMSFQLPHQKEKEKKITIEGMAVDFGFLETMGIRLKEGRLLSPEFGGDKKNNCLMNETAIKALGIDDPINYKLLHYEIVGVVKDFYLHSFHSEVPPLMINVSDRHLKQIAIQYKEGTLDDLMPALEKSWDKMGSEQAFSAVQVEDIIRELYSDEKNKFTIISVVAFFTMLIAAFGLFGLTLFITRSRTKEIGIRKVMGCSASTIILSFIKTNIAYVIIASFLSIPITLYAMNQWLSEYPVKKDIEWWFFALAFLIASIVVTATVFIHSYKASRMNPVKALRYE
jgi:putative ABC transport system permease protein